MPHLPSTTALRCFDASARLLSFTKAAQTVNLTQSAVSHHIQVLERELGVELFERERGGLKLTPSGQRYWDDIGTALHQLQRAGMRAAAGRHGALSLNIAVASAFANFWLMPRLGGFIEANPDILVNITNRVDFQNVFAGNEDAAIELCEGATPGIDACEVLSLVYKPYAGASLVESCGVPLDATGLLSADALQHLLMTSPLIRTSMAGAWPAWLQSARIENQQLTEKSESGPVYAQASLALSAATNGLGIALLPNYIASNAQRTGQLVRLSDVGWRANRSYFLRWPVGHSRSDALARFSGWIQSQSGSE